MFSKLKGWRIIIIISIIVLILYFGFRKNPSTDKQTELTTADTAQLSPVHQNDSIQTSAPSAKYSASEARAYLRSIYDTISNRYNMANYELFLKKLDDAEGRRKFFEYMSKEYDLGTFQQFTDRTDSAFIH